MSHAERFEAALASDDPRGALRSLALALAQSGLVRQQVYDEFLRFYERLQQQDREQDVNVMGDVMDMIMEQYAPFNLGLPDVKS